MATIVRNASVNGTTNESLSYRAAVLFLHQTQEGQIAIAFLVLEAVLIVLTNTLVFVLVARYKALRRKSNYCLISLAISDILAGVISLPLVLACSCTHLPSLCTAMDLCQRFLSISTIFHLVVATGERYLKIRNPFRYKYLATSARIIGVLIVVWVFSLTISLIQLTWIFNDENEQNKNWLSHDLIYAIICVTGLAFLPFLVIVSAYGHMIYIIRQESKARKALTSYTGKKKIRKSQRRRENERKVLFVYLAMAISFVLGWFPYFIITVMRDLGWVKVFLPFFAQIIFVCLKFTTAFINPLLYTYFKADFQKAARDFFKKTKGRSSASLTCHTGVQSLI